MTRTTIKFEPFTCQESTARLTNVHGKGGENASCWVAINVQNFVQVGSMDGAVDLVLQLHVDQVAEIVKGYFQEITSPGNIFTNLLRRLLKRRWQLMTHERFKEGSRYPSMKRYYRESETAQ